MKREIEGRTEGKGREGRQGFVGAASKDQRLSCIVACILGAGPGAALLRRRILAGQYGVPGAILFFVYVLVVRFTLLWRPQGELARIPRHITLETPANHRPSGNCTDPAEPALISSQSYYTLETCAEQTRRQSILFLKITIRGIVRFFRGVLALDLRGLCYHAKVHGPRHCAETWQSICVYMA